MSENPKSLLDVANLKLELKRELLFEGLSFTLLSGEVVLLTGANGSGKTLLLNVIGGKRAASEGTITGDRSRTLLLPTFYEAWGWRTLYSELKRLARQDHTELALPAVILYLGLEEYLTHRLSQLSCGLRQRASLATLMLRPSTIWLLDDPALALDPIGCDMLQGLIAGHLRKGGGVIVTTKREEEAKQWLPSDAVITHLSLDDMSLDE